MESYGSGKFKLVLMCSSFNNGEATRDFLSSISEFTVRKACPYDFKILLRDDGSTDRTPEILRRYVADIENIIFHESKSNLGQALSNAQLAQMAPPNADAYIFADSDGEESVEQIAALLARWSKQRGRSVVGLIGSLSSHASKTSAASRIAWAFFSWIQGGAIVPGQATLRVIDSKSWPNFRRSLILSEGFLGLAQTISGSPTDFVEIVKTSRGATSYSVFKRLKLAYRLVVASPGSMLKLSTFAIRVSLALAVGAVSWFLAYGLNGGQVAGYASMGASVVGVLAMVLFFQGQILRAQYRSQNLLLLSSSIEVRD